jgi:hypothetical protein
MAYESKGAAALAHARSPSHGAAGRARQGVHPALREPPAPQAFRLPPPAPLHSLGSSAYEAEHLTSNGGVKVSFGAPPLPLPASTMAALLSCCSMGLGGCTR